MAVCNEYIYENLKPLFSLGPQTSLCIYEPSKVLYVVKRVPIEIKSYYERIAKTKSRSLVKPLYLTQEEGELCVVSEYVSGESLSARLRRGVLLPKEALRMIISVCEGLSELHRQGLVHRDINPNNILLTSDGDVRIIDFGILRSFLAEKSTDTVILGTPGYAAPEQFGFSQSDARTDIYAVGVLLNVMLTGSLPSERVVSGPFGAIVKKCIEIDSKKRFVSVEELSKELKKLSGENTSQKPSNRLFVLDGWRAELWTIFVVCVLADLVFVGFEFLMIPFIIPIGWTMKGLLYVSFYFLCRLFLCRTLSTEWKRELLRFLVAYLLFSLLCIYWIIRERIASGTLQL